MTRKQLLIRALICFVIAAAALLLMIRLSFAHEPGEPWPANSCGEQVRAIMEQRPDITVFWSMINQPGHPGHGQWHVQAYDPLVGAWLTIDQWHRITEHSEPEYNLFPRIEIPGKKWLEMIDKRERGTR